MARKARVEVEGGLYHVITRGNNRRQIFNSPADYHKFLSMLAVQKFKLPFFLYAYCLMSNQVVGAILGCSAGALGGGFGQLIIFEPLEYWDAKKDAKNDEPKCEEMANDAVRQSS